MDVLGAAGVDEAAAGDVVDGAEFAVQAPMASAQTETIVENLTAKMTSRERPRFPG